MTITLRQIVSQSDALAMVFAMQGLYTAWTEVDVPKQFYDIIGTPKRFHRPSDEERDDRSQGGPLRRQGLRSATRSQGQGSQVSPSYYEGGQQRATLPFQSDDSSSVTDDSVFDDDTDWIECIHSWQSKARALRKVVSRTYLMTRATDSLLPTSMNMPAPLLL